jgi:hypothetical protein
MAFDGTEGAAIEPVIAGDWTRNFRENSSPGNNAHFFGRAILERLLDAEGAMGIRFYYGLDDDGNRQLLAVATDAEQNDLLEGENIVADESSCCPPWSSVSNLLNS